jgi:hypothetical protein
MKTIDFSKSFFTWRVDTLKKPPKTASHQPPYSLNNARVQADCHLEIKDQQSNAAYEFVLGANCKTERVGVDRDIWLEPNADFVPVMSQDYFMAFKAFDRADKGVMLHPPSLGPQPEKQIITVTEAFDSARIDISYCDGEILESAERINQSVLANHPLVARTEIASERYKAVLTYPVKTMNANERDQVYQTDTGPVLLPDLSRDPERLMGGMELAFAAFNCPSWTEFIVRTKTPIREGLSVYHYSKSVRIDCRNQVLRLKP